MFLAARLHLAYAMSEGMGWHVHFVVRESPDDQLRVSLGEG